VKACEEVIAEGEDPESDIAVSILTRRIGFTSPAESMGFEEWHELVRACQHSDREPLKLNPEIKN
jgi:hypothetical protein